MDLPDREIPAGFYASLRLKYGLRFPEIITNAEPDTVNGGHGYTLQGKIFQYICVSYSPILVTTPYEAQLCVNHLMHIHLTAKPPFHPCTPATKPGFGPGRFVLPTKTSASTSTYTDVHSSPLNHHLQTIFQHKVTGARIIAKNITSFTLLHGDCDIHMLPPFL